MCSEFQKSSMSKSYNEAKFDGIAKTLLKFGTPVGPAMMHKKERSLHINYSLLI